MAVLQEHIFLNVKWVEVHKWVKFFGQNSIVKWVISFASFCWLWHFLLENLKLKRISDNIHWNVWTNIKKFYAWNSIFQKKKEKIQIWDFESFIFWSKESFIFYILGTALGHFGQCVFFSFFAGSQPWRSTSLLSPSTIKKCPMTMFSDNLSYDTRKIRKKINEQ